MATDIFDKSVSDHVVFDRIVDCDRTITLARQAAAKAEEQGKPDKAAVLRAKADYLEQILRNTQDPDYSDEEDDSVNNSGTGESEIENSEEDEIGDTKAESEDTEPEEETKAQEDSTSEEIEEKTPEDIKNLGDFDGSHEDGTKKSDQGGPTDSGEDGADSGSSGENENQKQKPEDNNNSGNNEKQSKSKDFDPFRQSLSSSGSQNQFTPEEELEAIIKRLAGLTGGAKKGADQALQDFFNQITGGDSL